MPEPAFKKHSVFLGASGSGKTELSVNFAILARRRAGRRVIFIDMDQTKGLFRARDFFDELRAEGVEPVDTFAFQDAPVIPAGVAAAIDDKDAMCVFDVGGNAAGAVMIGQFVEKLPVEDTDYFFVINPCRPLSATAAGLERGMVEILCASGIDPAWLKVISNPNMGRETSRELILGRHAYLQELLSGLGMSACAIAADRALSAGLEEAVGSPVLPLRLYMRSLY